MISQGLSEDSKAILLLCSSIALRHLPSEGQDALTPLTLKQWNGLAKTLQNSVLQRPQALLETTPADWQRELSLTDAQTARLTKLIAAGGSLAIELENLERLGIWVTTRAETAYPARLKTLLKEDAPAVLFGAGDLSLLKGVGVAIVGSRDIDETGTLFTQQLSQHCVENGFGIVSGGARGVDQLAQAAAIAAGGTTVAVLADSLAARIRKREIREAIATNQLLLLTPHHPEASFKVWAAMERNKLIYALSRYAFVVAASESEGGTWHGATQNLKAGWVPLLVRLPIDSPSPGNAALIKAGGLPFAPELLAQPDFNLASCLASQTIPSAPLPSNKSAAQTQLSEEQMVKPKARGRTKKMPPTPEMQLTLF